jgi:hypothetical protein
MRLPWKYNSLILYLHPKLLDLTTVKKSLTLLLLLLFVLNIVGYYGVFVGLRLSADRTMREQFDADSYISEEVTFKVPIAIPYASDSREFERVDGEFEHEGQVYRLVKQKLQSDTLYIVCVKDHQAQKINQALADYVKSYTDKPFNAKQSVKSMNVFSKDFISTAITLEASSTGWDFLSVQSAGKPDLYQFDYNPQVVHPPEA